MFTLGPAQKEKRGRDGQMNSRRKEESEINWEKMSVEKEKRQLNLESA